MPGETEQEKSDKSDKSDKNLKAPSTSGTSRGSQACLTEHVMKDIHRAKVLLLPGVHVSAWWCLHDPFCSNHIATDQDQFFSKRNRPNPWPRLVPGAQHHVAGRTLPASEQVVNIKETFLIGQLFKPYNQSVDNRPGQRARAAHTSPTTSPGTLPRPTATCSNALTLAHQPQHC